MAGVSSFTSTGKKIPYSKGTNPSPLGKVIDGVVYQHPRLRKDEGLGGGNVRFTNPRASVLASRRRTPSLGMAGALSSKRDY